MYDYTKEQMKTVLDDAKKYTDKRFNDVIDNAMSNVVNIDIKAFQKEARQAAAVGLAV